MLFNTPIESRLKCLTKTLCKFSNIRFRNTPYKISHRRCYKICHCFVSEAFKVAFYYLSYALFHFRIQNDGKILS
ncbi:MAG: hypothetical protein BGO03_08725 [Mesorhizobium sp. 61-13]|nr:MAG: hypothetical protein BGO03_08725 [Mesorhizobium sp. 61-13]